MEAGEIYYWNTEKVAGRDSRFKYHVFIAEPDGLFEHTFLFINKTDYGGDYLITKTDYPFFPLVNSYIDLGGIIPYTDAELAAANPERKGILAKKHMQELFNAILNSGKMPRREEKLVCNVLKQAF